MSDKEKNKNFINYICNRCKSDKGIAAHLRRADITSCDAVVLSILVRFGLDVTKDIEFIPYCLVTAAIARGKIYESGEYNFIQLLSLIEKQNKNKEKDDTRIRRLLACENLSDLSLIFRQLINLIQSRSNFSINYEEMLDDLCSFAYEDGRIRVKRKWAGLFYKHVTKDVNQES